MDFGGVGTVDRLGNVFKQQVRQDAGEDIARAQDNGVGLLYGIQHRWVYVGFSVPLSSLATRVDLVRVTGRTFIPRVRGHDTGN